MQFFAIVVCKVSDGLYLIRYDDSPKNEKIEAPNMFKITKPPENFAVCDAVKVLAQKRNNTRARIDLALKWINGTIQKLKPILVFRSFVCIRYYTKMIKRKEESAQNTSKKQFNFIFCYLLLLF